MNRELPDQFPKTNWHLMYFATDSTKATTWESSYKAGESFPSLVLNLLPPISHRKKRLNFPIPATYSLHCSSFFWLTKISIIGS